MISLKLAGLLMLLGCCLGNPVEFYGDLPLENPDLVGGDMLGLDDDRNAVVNKNKLWPGGIVPYVKDPSLDPLVMKFILDKAFKQYHTHTCIRFVPRTNEKDYIRIFSGKGCYSQVGRLGGSQPLSLGKGCEFEPTIVHELGHAIGFYHEQNRSDRDDYIRIIWENIQEGAAEQFFKLKPHQNQLLTPFDYQSIMLYGSLTFSKDRKANLITMEAKDGTFLREVFSKGKLSPSDILRVKKLYNC